MEKIIKDRKIYTAKKGATWIGCAGCIFSKEAYDGNDKGCKEAPSCSSGIIFTKVEEMKK